MSKPKPLDRVREFLKSLDASEHWPKIEPLLTQGALLRRASAMVALSHVLETSTRKDAALLGTEAVADAQSATLLSILGAYKSSMMVLRSAIESAVRCYLLVQTGGNYTSFDVPKLFRDAYLDARALGRPAFRAVIGLRANYKHLCRYVHSSTPDVMSLDARLGQIPSFHEGRAKHAFARLAEVSRLVIDLVFLAFADEVRSAHPDIRDEVLDNVSWDVKALR